MIETNNVLMFVEGTVVCFDTDNFMELPEIALKHTVCMQSELMSCSIHMTLWL